MSTYSEATVPKWEAENYGSALEKAVWLLDSALVELRKLKPTDHMEFVLLDALRQQIAEFTEDPDA